MPRYGGAFGKPMNYRRTLIRVVTFLGGLYFFLEFILPQEVFGDKTAAYHQDISNGLIAVSAMALGLGIINILMVHGSRIMFRRAGYPYSVALLLGLGLMLAATIVDWRSTESTAADVSRYFVLRDFSDRIERDAQQLTYGVLPFWERNGKLKEAALPLLAEAQADISALSLPGDAAESDRAMLASLVAEMQSQIGEARAALDNLPVVGSAPEAVARSGEVGRALGAIGSSRLAVLNITSKYTPGRRLYDFLYTGLFVALGAAMFSLLGFYIASAAYRAFRIRSSESALMMAAAFLVMLGQIPFGLWIWSELPEVRLWLLSVPSAAAFRAIKIGAGVAGLVMAYRMWFSIESEEFRQRGR